MQTDPSCPQCSSPHVYMDGTLWICPECAFEWSSIQADANDEGAGSTDDSVIKDANGQILIEGDTIIVLKDLKIKGSSSSVKSGTKVKGIRITDGGDGHNISGKIAGLGTINLKSEFVKKV